MLQRSAEYRRAVRLYRAGDRAAARSLLQRLQASYASAAQQQFLRRQIAIAAGVPGSEPSGPSSPPARPIGAAGRLHAVQPARSPSAQPDCGPRALLAACARLGIRADLVALTRTAGTTSRGTTLAGLARAARSVGLRARGVQVDRPALARLDAPALAWVDGEHYVAVLAVQSTGETGTATVRDPSKPREEVMPIGELLRRSGGILLLLSR